MPAIRCYVRSCRPFDFTFFLNDLDHGRRDDGRESFQVFGHDICLLAGEATSPLTDPNNDNAASYDVRPCATRLQLQWQTCCVSVDASDAPGWWWWW